MEDFPFTPLLPRWGGDGQECLPPHPSPPNFDQSSVLSVALHCSGVSAFGHRGLGAFTDLESYSTPFSWFFQST